MSAVTGAAPQITTRVLGMTPGLHVPTRVPRVARGAVTGERVAGFLTRAAILTRSEVAGTLEFTLTHITGINSVIHKINLLPVNTNLSNARLNQLRWPVKT